MDGDKRAPGICIEFMLRSNSALYPLLCKNARKALARQGSGAETSKRIQDGQSISLPSNSLQGKLTLRKEVRTLWVISKERSILWRKALEQSYHDDIRRVRMNETEQSSGATRRGRYCHVPTHDLFATRAHE